MQARHQLELFTEPEMFHSEKTAAEYDHWFETEAGRFAFLQEKKLIQHLVSAWPRRKQSLLDIGCGTGVFLQLFWESGFDVYGMDSSAGMLARARQKMGHRVDLHLGKAQHLPFDDNEFDFSSIITVLEFCREPDRVIREAARVSKKGMLICHLNKTSFYYLNTRFSSSKSRKMLKSARWFTFGQMKRLIRENLGPRHIYALSVLPGTKTIWKDHWLTRYLHVCFWPPFMGTFTGIRVDLLDHDPLKTPLMAIKKEIKAG